MKFCDKLSRLRKANNLSQEQLADKLGVTRQSVSKWESGESYPDMGRIIEICKVLDCKLNDIMEDGLIDENVTNKDINSALEKDFSDFKKYLDSFLSYVTKTYNMIIHMKFKELIKMLFEMIVHGFVLGIIIDIICSSIETFISNLSLAISVPTIRLYMDIILSSIIKAAFILTATVVFFHIFKIRYLDYYITVQDTTITSQKEELPIEENKSVLNPENEPKIIIRDTKHTNSLFLDGLLKVLGIILKIILIVVAVPIVIGELLGIAAIIFCLFSKCAILSITSLMIVGVILFGIVLLIIIFNIIFNHKHQYKILLILFISSIVISGIGIGAFGNEINKIEVVDNYDDLKYVTEENILDNFTLNDYVYIDSNNIEYIVDENEDKIKIEFSYPEGCQLDTAIGDGEYSTSYYFYLTVSDISQLKNIINDLKDNKIHNSYNALDLLKAKVTCNSENMKLFKQIEE